MACEFWRPYAPIHPTFPILKVLRAKDDFLELEGGRKLWDGISSWWVITLGHSHPVLQEALQKQGEKVSQVVFADFHTESAEALQEAFNELVDSSLNRIFLSDNGSTAVEVALKMALQYWQQQGFPEKKYFLAFENAFHGETIGALSVSASSLFTQAFESVRFPVIRSSFEKYEETLEAFSDQLAGVLLEPLLQGAGGMRVREVSCLQKIVDQSRSRGLLVIFDEVLTGFGRTGRCFAYEHLNNGVPDFLCLSKGLTGGVLPLGATLTRSEIQTVFKCPPLSNRFFHGHSFTGNALSTAVAAAHLKYFKTHKKLLLNQWTLLEKTHQASLKALQKRLPLQRTSSLGTMGALEVNLQDGYGSSFSVRVAQKARQKGVFTRPLGSVFYLLPPYCTRPDTLTWAWEILGNCIEKEIEALMDVASPRAFQNPNRNPNLLPQDAQEHSLEETPSQTHLQAT